MTVKDIIKKLQNLNPDYEPGMEMTINALLIMADFAGRKKEEMEK
jgi:hypothetical protein